jgi:hypothetical protein
MTIKLGDLTKKGLFWIAFSSVVVILLLAARGLDEVLSDPINLVLLLPLGLGVGQLVIGIGIRHAPLTDKG